MMDTAILHRRNEILYEKFRENPTNETGFELLRTWIDLIEVSWDCLLPSGALLHVIDQIRELKGSPHEDYERYQKSLRDVETMEESMRVFALGCIEVCQVLAWIKDPITAKQTKQLIGIRAEFLKACRQLPQENSLFHAMGMAFERLRKPGNLERFSEFLSKSYGDKVQLLKAIK